MKISRYHGQVKKKRN